MFNRHCLFVAALYSAFAFADGPGKPPAFPPGDLVTDYQGVRVADPYRALEQVDSAPVRAWAGEQGDYTRRMLDRLPSLATLRARIDALDADQSPVVTSLKVTPRGQFFYLKRMPGESFTKLYVRQTAAAPERVLLDPAAWKRSTGVSYSINNFTAAPDGRHVAAVISKEDAELGDLKIYDVATGAEVMPAVPAIWGELSAVWTRDGRAVQYMQGLDALKPDGIAFGKIQVFERRLAGGPDRKLLGFASGFGPEIRQTDWTSSDPSSSATFTVVGRQTGVSGNTRVAFTRTASLQRDPTSAMWTSLFGDDAKVSTIGVHGHFLYARTFDQAARYRVVRYDLDAPSKPPIEVVAEQTGVLEDMAPTADGLYYTMRTGSVTDLFVLRYDAKNARKVALPFVGAASLFDADPSLPGVNIALEGWARARDLFHVRGTQARRLALVPPSASKVGEDWVSEETTCTSHDGVEVPMSLIYRKGLVKDGSHPTLMDGYGGYGISEPAYFNRRLDPWYQRGGIFVNVKPRGGGAFGREWYQAGVGPRKSNTWKDMIACAQALVERGYTSPAKLAIQGTSMGGVAVGRAITERPDLFGVAIVRVGITDTIRFIEATSNGPNHLEEMGTIQSADGVRQLLAMSTYDHVAPGTAYPATLFTAGLNDNRVAPWITFKTFARMSAATSSGEPVMLRIEAEGGHGVSTTATQRNAELADRLAFSLWNFGDADFQPQP